MSITPDRRLAAIAAGIIALDQLTKLLVERWLPFNHERIVLEGFFKFVHWGNKGAAWSFLRDTPWSNELFTVVSLAALLLLFLNRRHFHVQRLSGQLALGLLFGGIVGNLIDRLLPMRRHVVDFLYFYLQRRSGEEIGFPAFNVADSAICVGVGLLFLLSWTQSQEPPKNARAPAASGSAN